MPKIPCPSCREPNFDTDIVCWKCGEPLRKQDGPQVYQPKHKAQMNVSAPRGLSGVVLPDDSARAGGFDLVMAAVIGGAIGVLVSILLNVPFLMWLKASYRPYSDAIPFMVWMTAAGGVGGALSATNRYGAVAGLLLYEIAFLAVRAYSMVVPIAIPPILSLFNQYGAYYATSGLISGYAALLGASLVLRCLGRNSVLPAQSGSSPFAQQSGRFGIAVLLFLCLFAYDAWRYFREIGEAARSPRSVVMGYCRAMVSTPNGDLSRIRPMLTGSLTNRIERDPSTRSALNPEGVFLSPEIVDHITKDRLLPSPAEVDVLNGTATVEIVERGKALLRSDGPKRSPAPIHIVFELSRSKDKWLIAQPPRLWQESL